MHVGKKSSSDDKKYPPGSFKGRLKERKIIATFAAFAGSGVVIIELAHHILVNHYHFPDQIVDFCIVTIAGALIATLTWRWFRGSEKRPGNVKVEVLVVPLIILLTLVIDLRLIFAMTGVSMNLLLIGIVALCLGIAWVVFKSLQWAASVPEAEKKVEVLKPEEEKPISFPEWKKSIVVLPFENISPEDGQDYFCDGMTEEIINALIHIGDLRVVARTSAFSFKGKDINIRKIGKELDVGKVLRGSVRKEGERLRIMVQLINVSDGYNIWSERFDSNIGDVFDIQDAITLAIVNKLKVKLLKKEKETLAKHGTDDVDAYNLYLKGRYVLFEMMNPAFIEQSIEFYNQALKIHPDYALAYAGLANSYYGLGWFAILPPKEAFPKAEEMANKALEIDDSIDEALIALSYINSFYHWNWMKAEKYCKRALEINPNSSWAHLVYAWYFITQSRLDEAIDQVKQAQDVDPLSLLVRSNLAMVYYMRRELEKAIEELTGVLELNPKFSLARSILGCVYEQDKKYEKAIKEFQVAYDLTGSAYDLSRLSHAYAMAGKKSKAQNILDDIIKQRDQVYVSPYDIARVYIGLGDKELAFTWLEKAFEERTSWLAYLNVDPIIDDFRSDTRLTELKEKIGFRQ